MNEAEQVQLFSPQEEEAFFLPKDELYRRHSGKTAGAIEERREAILMLVASHWPVTEIERRLHVSRKTISQLSVMFADQVSKDVKAFSRWVLGLGAKWYALADEKSEGAPFLHLAQASSYALQRGLEMQASADATMDGDALDVEVAPSETRSKVLEWAKGPETPATAAQPSALVAETDKPVAATESKLNWRGGRTHVEKR